MSHTPSSELNPADQPSTADQLTVDHASIRTPFITTIRVERTVPETYRATQHDTEIKGYGSTPHLAIIDNVRRTETACVGDESPAGDRPASAGE